MLFAFGVHEICDRWKHGVDLLASKESAIDIFLGYLSVIFVWVLNVNVANQMIAEIIDYNHVLNLAELTHFFEDIFVEILEPVC